MYNVGFGDCFLLQFPRDADLPFRILVDCGAHASGYPVKGWKPEDVVDEIVADVTAAGESSIDVVVASHRHQDHVSGFRAPNWSTVRVGEVWLPWTEDPRDDLAAEIRNRQSRLALGLDLAFRDSSFASRWTNAAAADGLRALAANCLTNEAAMRTLHRGFRGNPVRRFLSAGDPATIAPEGCPGLTVHILAPSKDPDVIRDMDPPTGQSYLRFVSAAQPDTPDPRTESSLRGSHKPFSRSFTLSVNQYEGGGAGPSLDSKIKDAAASIMRDDDLAAAVSLDKAVNGTSLVLMFEFRDAFLLFPGDAQWGSWDAALRDPTTRELLAKTTFYKVGHHGSHNATPVEFVEKVLQKEHPIWGAGASVHPISFWPEIPRTPLLEALGTRSERLVRSDHPGRSRSGISVKRTHVGFEVPC
jgi:beta-lactamase superfamily II metal-dependent hydrolase